ncbi:FAD-dependent oxidoreductase [Streptomyces sp. S.PB5]|uniref:FAD-dependent oxidoreductase n=1 Tax=Streptomyces sp. S.PB5 TaxID=3020844 RepID=UPI0025B152BE|nr:FAD-dependent oxidoreductase [Streptomyces sp. S.PB5]MDN3029597.1 FAD-dependent oxidoreductase [Streptomyces sp. S.PB5]
MKPTPVSKVLMEFSRPVLPYSADYVTEPAVPSFSWNTSKGTPGFSGQVVVGWMQDDEAREMLALSRRRRHRHVLDVIRGIAGDRRLKPVKVIEHERTKDPFARAAYSEYESVPPGGPEILRAARGHAVRLGLGVGGRPWDPCSGPDPRDVTNPSTPTCRCR